VHVNVLVWWTAYGVVASAVVVQLLSAVVGVLAWSMGRLSSLVPENRTWLGDYWCGPGLHHAADRVLDGLQVAGVFGCRQRRQGRSDSA
jgi:hypothetical protein